MSELTDVVNSLEIKFARLVQKLNVLEAENTELKKTLLSAEEEIRRNEKQLDSIYEKYESLRLASSLLGSEENRRDTKLKINSLIKEIDQCIAHLTK